MNPLRDIIPEWNIIPELDKLDLAPFLSQIESLAQDQMLLDIATTLVQPYLVYN